MRLFRFLSLTVLLLLPACSNLGEFGKPGPVQSVFSRTLDIEYAALADYEEKVAMDPDASASFRQKSVQAHQGILPPPDDPDTMKGPPASHDALAQAHAVLIQSLQKGDWIDNGPAMAMAQTQFDCWAALQAAKGQPDSGEGCHQKYQEAMNLLAPPAPQIGTYAVYFNTNSIEVNDAGMKDIADAARILRDQPDWVVELSGYIAPDETGEGINTLSIRRCMAVRNALAQEGASLASIRIGNYGPAPEGTGAQLDRERRVDLQTMPADKANASKPAEVEGILPENFSTIRPVF